MSDEARSVDAFDHIEISIRISRAREQLRGAVGAWRRTADNFTARGVSTEGISALDFSEIERAFEALDDEALHVAVLKLAREAGMQ